MGRELQKRKNRSSINKVRKKPKSKKLQIRSHPLIAANWDKSLTLAQNYRQLGLTSRLQKRSGGEEKQLRGTQRVVAQDHLHAAFRSAKTIQPGEAQLQRDPVSGVVSRVRSDEDDTQSTEEFDGFSASSRDESEDHAKQPGRSIIRELERQAALPVVKRVRPINSRDRAWLTRLEDRWGDDFDAMMRDRKLNPYQHTAADLRRQFRRWKAEEPT